MMSSYSNFSSPIAKSISWLTLSIRSSIALVRVDLVLGSKILACCNNSDDFLLDLIKLLIRSKISLSKVEGV